MQDSWLRPDNSLDPAGRVVTAPRVNRLFLITFLLAAAIIALTMFSAQRRGMDHAVMIGVGDQTAIAISLSDSVYNVRLGYVGMRKVFDTIHSYWNRDAPWSDLEQLKKNFHDADLLNEGIRAAASLGPQLPGYFSDGSLITTFHDDMGEVDYVSLAFALFGLNVQAMFYLYFTLLGLSAFVFLLAFRDRIFALVLLLTTLFAYYLELHLKIFDPVALTSYWGMRHSSTLCVVPVLHLAFLLLWRRKLSLATGAGAVVQLFILILAWRIRGSVAWVFVFLPTFAIALALIDGPWVRPRRSWWRSWAAARGGLGDVIRSSAIVAGSWRMLVRRTLQWPLVLLLLGLLANGPYNRVALHPIYHGDDVMSYHGIWHSMQLGLALYAPDVLTPRVRKIVQTEGLSDGLTVWHARDYLDRIHLIPWNGKPEYVPPAPGYLSAFTGIGLKIMWHERTLRQDYFTRLREHPSRSLELYASMPGRVVGRLFSPFSEAPTLAWLWMVIAAGAGVLMVLLRFAGNSDRDDGRRVLLVCAAAFATATLPCLISYAATHSMLDGVILVAAWMPTAIGIGAYAIVRKVAFRRTAAA